MAVVVLDESCPLCDRMLEPGEPAWAAWSMFAAGELTPLCARAMHWSCWLAWPRRAELTRAGLAAWRVHVAEHPECHRVLETPAVHASVHMPHHGGEVAMYLAATGSLVRVPLDDWDAFLRFPPTGLQPAEADAWSAVRDTLRAALPSAAMIRGNYQPLPENHIPDLEPAINEAAFAGQVKAQRWKELLALQKEGMEKSYFRRLIEFVGCHPDDQEACDRLRDGRPWVDRFLFEKRLLIARREQGLLWVLTGGWPRPTEAGVLAAARDYCEAVADKFPETRVAQLATKLAGKWALARARMTE